MSSPLAKQLVQHLHKQVFKRGLKISPNVPSRPSSPTRPFEGIRRRTGLIQTMAGERHGLRSHSDKCLLLKPAAAFHCEAGNCTWRVWPDVTPSGTFTSQVGPLGALTARL